jgi:hypothetical protein
MKFKIVQDAINWVAKKRNTQCFIKSYLTDKIKNYKFEIPNGGVNQQLKDKGEALLATIRLYVDELDNNQLLTCIQLIHQTQKGITNPGDIDNLNEIGKLIEQAPGQRNLPKTIAGLALTFVGIALLIGSLIVFFASGGLSTPLTLLGIGLFCGGLVGTKVGPYLFETGQEKNFSIAGAACNFWKTLNGTQASGTPETSGFYPPPEDFYAQINSVSNVLESR